MTDAPNIKKSLLAFGIELAEAEERERKHLYDAAYFNWLNAGSPEGRNLEFWIAAERQIFGCTQNEYYESLEQAEIEKAAQYAMSVDIEKVLWGKSVQDSAEQLDREIMARLDHLAFEKTKEGTVYLIPGTTVTPDGKIQFPSPVKPNILKAFGVVWRRFWHRLSGI